jgi:transcriptional regulator of aromatic amino acid metabolism
MLNGTAGVRETPREFQSRLLCLLQEPEIERVAEKPSRRVDVAIIAASNLDVQAESRTGRFRERRFYASTSFPSRVYVLENGASDNGPPTAQFVQLRCRQGHPVSREPVSVSIDSSTFLIDAKEVNYGVQRRSTRRSGDAPQLP